MKQKDINTGINVPSPSRYNWTDKDRIEAEEFKAAIVKFLGLPENWEQYFKFTSTSDFITLEEKGHYKTEVFRRFKRRNVATVPADLKQRLTNHIEWKNSVINSQNDKQLREDGYKQMLKPFTSENSPTNEWHISYYKESEGLKISLLLEAKNWHTDQPEMRDFAHAYIRHTGEIKEPAFDCSIKYTANISQAQAFIDQYREYHNKIMAKADEIKSQLPAEFFTPVTETA
jgi:hypothetical protein